MYKRQAIKLAYKSIFKELVRDRVVSGGPRLDGRSPTDIRTISSEINLLPMVHGSSLFLRGETQVLNVTTLGMSRLEQMLDTIDTVTSKRYMHHYNFPPYSTGEAYMMRGPKRREKVMVLWQKKRYYLLFLQRLTFPTP